MQRRGQPVLVRVEWVDPTGLAGTWIHRDQAVTLEPMRCTTVGTILKRTKSLLILAASQGEEGQVSDVTAIPRACVRKITRLR